MIAVSCRSSSSPTSSLVDALTVRVVPKNPVRLNLDALEARVQSFRPYRWSVAWTVIIQRAKAASARGLDVRSVRARVEAGGRVLAETATPTGSQRVTDEGIGIEQSLTYESAGPPPSQSRLVITVDVLDEDTGAGQEVSTAGNTIEEQYCGGRAQPPCSSGLISILTDGTLRRDGSPDFELWVGQRADFFNAHNAAHRFRSDPHPSHADCDALNQVDLGAGQYASSEVFNKPGTCGFHDEGDPNNAALRSRIVVRCCLF